MRIAFAGSRDLGDKILRLLISSQSTYSYSLVGAVAPNYVTWWKDEIRNTCQTNEIKIYHNLEGLVTEQKPDIIFSINYWKTISIDIINEVPLGIVNLHHSYMLRLRGRYSTSWALLRARMDDYWWHGSTLHYIDKELDSGLIIVSEKCPIHETDTAEILFDRVEKLAYLMFLRNFAKIIRGDVQTSRPAKSYYYYSKESKDISRLVNEDDSFLDVFDKCRAWSYKDRPGVYYVTQNGVRYKIHVERVDE